MLEPKSPDSEESDSKEPDSEGRYPLQPSSPAMVMMELIVKAATIVTEMESLGNLRKQQPEIKFIIEFGKISGPNEFGYVCVEISLDFPGGKTECLPNCSGQGRTLEEALLTCTWGLKYELERKMKKQLEVLEELKALPTDFPERPLKEKL